nr:tyrosine-type recombinase/integrase [Mumia quercus]
MVRLVRDQRARPPDRDRAGPHRALHSPARRGRPGGLVGEHDDACRTRVLQVRPHRRHHPCRPGRVRPATQGPSRRVPHPKSRPTRVDPIPPSRPNHHRPPRCPGLPARHQRPAGLRSRRGADRGLRRHPPRSPGAAPGRQGQQARHHAARAATDVREPIDRRDAYRMVQRIAKSAGIPRHISPHSLRHAAITNALDAGVPLRDAQILARHADPRTTEHYDRARGNLDRHGVHSLTAYVAGV